MNIRHIRQFARHPHFREAVNVAAVVIVLLWIAQCIITIHITNTYHVEYMQGYAASGDGLMNAYIFTTK